MSDELEHADETYEERRRAATIEYRSAAEAYEDAGAGYIVQDPELFRGQSDTVVKAIIQKAFPEEYARLVAAVRVIELLGAELDSIAGAAHAANLAFASRAVGDEGRPRMRVLWEYAQEGD